MSIFSSFHREFDRIWHRPRYLILLTLGLVFSYVFFLTLMAEGQPQRLPVAIVDCDGSYFARRLAHELNATSGVEVAHLFNNHAQAREAMQRGEIYAFLEIPDGTYAAVLDFKAPHIAVYSNNAYMLPGSLSYKSLATISKLAAAAVQREVLRKKGYDEQLIMGNIQPIEIDTHCISNPTADYRPYVLPTLLQGILGVMVLLLSCYEIRRERAEGTEKEWLASANGNMLAALGGKLLPYTLWFGLLGTLGNIIMFGFGQFTLLGSFAMLTVTLMLYILAQQLMAVVLCGLIPDMHLSICVAAIYGMLAFTMSGFSFPVTSMPPFIQGFSILFPLRQYYLAYVDIALYGCGLGYYWPHIAILLVYMAFGLLGGFMLDKEFRTNPTAETLPAIAPFCINSQERTGSLWHRFIGFLNHVWEVMCYELRTIFSDAGVMLLFFIASLLYPLLFAAIYTNETVTNVPVAVVDESASPDSRRMIHKLEATPELAVDYYCCTMTEAEELMKRHSVRGVVYFPRDYATRLAQGSTARIGLFCDMSSFLYYRSVYSAAQIVMLDEMKQIELCRYEAAGLTGEAARVQLTPVEYDDVKLFSPAGGFESFLVPGLLVLVVFQTFFLGICVLTGTHNQRRQRGCCIYHGAGRIVIGRTVAYLLMYIPVVAVDLVLLPRLFHLPCVGRLGDIILFLLPFLLASIAFFLTISAVVRERDTGVLVFIFFSLVLIFSSGLVWPACGMPDVWRWMGWLFPSTHGLEGFVRINSMGAHLSQVRFEYLMLWAETAFYFLTACHVEHWRQKHFDRLAHNKTASSAFNPKSKSVIQN